MKRWSFAVSFLVCSAGVWGGVSFTNKDFPADAGWSSVKLMSYGATGNGITDDTEALRRATAVSDMDPSDFTRPRVLYFPPGTYVVSDSIQLPNVTSTCCLSMQGAGVDRTVIKLTSNNPKFQNKAAPKRLFCFSGGNMAFNYYIRDLTITTGSGNPGAIALQWGASNRGALRDIVVKSEDYQGVIGIDMTKQWPGPCMVDNVRVIGFDYGIKVACSEYGPTYEHIELLNQKVYGFHNTSNVVAIRDLRSVNTVPALFNAGTMILLDARCEGGSSANSAIVSSYFLYARNIDASGSSYPSAIKQGTTVVAGLTQAEYMSEQPKTLFTSPARPCNIGDIQETPQFHDNTLANWSKVTGESQIQTALNAGKATVYIPKGRFNYHEVPVTVPATVRKIVAFSTWFDSGPVFRVEQTSSDPLIFEGFYKGLTVRHACSRPVAITHCGGMGYASSAGAGPLFVEDVVEDSVTIRQGQWFWARQLNMEALDAPRTRIVNDGGSVWILGLKSEGAGSIVVTRNGGQTEFLGTLLYPVTLFSAAMKLEPAFDNIESKVSAIYSFSNYGSADFNYVNQIRETRGGVTKTLATTAFSRNVYYSGYPDGSIQRLDAKQPRKSAQTVHAGKTAYRLTQRTVTIPAGARAVEVYAPSGRLLWQYVRTGSAGSQTVAIPAELASLVKVVRTVR